MIRNYLKVAFRNFFRNKLYTTLNIAGLTFGMTCFLLIALYLFDELTFDRQHKNAGRTYRVIEQQTTDGKKMNLSGISYKSGEESMKTISEIENLTRFFGGGRDNISNPENQQKYYETIWAANSNFLQVFDFILLEGDRNTALKEPNSIILTKDLARKLFKSTGALGKSVKIDFIESPLKVTAVLDDLPSNSTFNFNLMISEATYREFDFYINAVASDWSSNNWFTYVLLKNSVIPATVATSINQVVSANRPKTPGISVEYSLQQLPDVYFHSGDIREGPFRKGNIVYIYIFGAVALFLLLIASINYMNLTTARASNRFKEIGIRKASGALRHNLAWQFMVESLLIAAIALILSVILVNLLLPFFNQFTEKGLSLGFSTDHRIWFGVIGFAIIVGLLSGSYPALMLSHFKPIALLRNLKINNKGASALRRGLVILQFTLSVVMIIATLVLFLQIKYVNTRNLGFNQDQLVVVDINSGQVRRSAETIKTEFSKIAEVRSVSASSRVPGEWKNIPTIKIKPEGGTRELQRAYLLSTDEQFAKTFEIQLLEGRNFTGRNDSSAVIINETAASQLGILSPSGQMIEIPSISFGGTDQMLDQSFKVHVIGIVRDFHFQSLREKIAPLVLTYQNRLHNIDYFTAKVEGKNAVAALAQMKEILAKIDANHLFEHHFLDDQLALFYREDKRRETILIWAALSTIFIACLGLFGLATYAAQQRIKEIGVRKVLGASVVNITTLLSKDFLKLVLIANGIAFPISYYVMNNWLQEFAYRIEIRWWVFAGAGFIALFIAFLTVSFQAIKTAIANPVRALRSE